MSKLCITRILHRSTRMTPASRRGGSAGPEDELDALLAEEESIANEYAEHLAAQHADSTPAPDASGALFLGEEPDAPPAPPAAPPVLNDTAQESRSDTSKGADSARRVAPVGAARLYAASASRTGIPKYIPAEPVFAVTTAGTPVTIPRRRRTRGWEVRYY